MQPLHINTPLLESQYLKNKLNKRVYFKLELLQPSGSFKLRGIGALCQHEWQLGVKHFAASSGGNAGIAVAYCGMKLGVPVTVFIPNSSHPIYIDAIKSYGADVIVAGGVWDDAHHAGLLCTSELFSVNISSHLHDVVVIVISKGLNSL